MYTPFLLSLTAGLLWWRIKLHRADLRTMKTRRKSFSWFDTVDGRNPAPPGMYTGANYLSTGAGFFPSTVAQMSISNNELWIILGLEFPIIIQICSHTVGFTWCLGTWICSSLRFRFTSMRLDGICVLFFGRSLLKLEQFPDIFSSRWLGSLTFTVKMFFAKPLFHSLAKGEENWSESGRFFSFLRFFPRTLWTCWSPVGLHNYARCFAACHWRMGEPPCRNFEQRFRVNCMARNWRINVKAAYQWPMSDNFWFARRQNVFLFPPDHWFLFSMLHFFSATVQLHTKMENCWSGCCKTAFNQTEPQQKSFSSSNDVWQKDVFK